MTDASQKRMVDFMLLTLKHLLVTLGLIAGGVLLGCFIARNAGLPEGSWAFIVLAVLAATVFGLGWPLYRAFHLRPLCLPRCPHCGRLHGNYHIPPEAWPCAVLICVSCGNPTRLCLSRKRPQDIGHDIPSLYLRWPEFLGLWRPVHGPKAQSVAPGPDP